jgi:hypothetical protein
MSPWPRASAMSLRASRRARVPRAGRLCSSADLHSSGVRRRGPRGSGRSVGATGTRRRSEFERSWGHAAAYRVEGARLSGLVEEVPFRPASSAAYECGANRTHRVPGRGRDRLRVADPGCPRGSTRLPRSTGTSCGCSMRRPRPQSVGAESPSSYRGAEAAVCTSIRSETLVTRPSLSFGCGSWTAKGTSFRRARVAHSQWRPAIRPRTWP